MHMLRISAALLLIGCYMASAASSSQDQIDLDIYVHEANLNGTLLSGVQVSGHDARGSSIDATSDENGMAVLKGQPGTWKLAFKKDGYENLELTYDATQTEDVAAYLEKTVSSSPISLTLYVYEGSMNGTALSGVKVTGTDAAGTGFSTTTDSSGTAILTGTPGSWEMTLTKDGYSPVVGLDFETTVSEEVGAYLQKAA